MNKNSGGKIVVVGSLLDIDREYFLECCDCLTELGFKLAQVLWRKLVPAAVHDADMLLIRTTYDMIAAEQYHPAIKILDFALKPPMKFEKDRDRLICLVNLAQAFKWPGDKGKCLATLTKQDWTATNIDFRLIVAVLKDNFGEAAKLMKQMGGSGEIGKEEYLDWPVFKEFRKSRQFVDAYKQVFKTEVEVRNMPADVDTLLSQVKVGSQPKQSEGSKKDALDRELRS